MCMDGMDCVCVHNNVYVWVGVCVCVKVCDGWTGR